MRYRQSHQTKQFVSDNCLSCLRCRCLTTDNKRLLSVLKLYCELPNALTSAFLPLPQAPSRVSPAKHFLRQINMQGDTKGILSRISTQPHISHSNIQLYPSEIKSTALKQGETRTSQANSSSFPFIPVLAKEADEKSITVVAPRCHRPRTPVPTGTALSHHPPLHRALPVIILMAIKAFMSTACTTSR